MHTNQSVYIVPVSIYTTQPVYMKSVIDLAVTLTPVFMVQRTSDTDTDTEILGVTESDTDTKILGITESDTEILGVTESDTEILGAREADTKILGVRKSDTDTDTHSLLVSKMSDTGTGNFGVRAKAKVYGQRTV